MIACIPNACNIVLYNKVHIPLNVRNNRTKQGYMINWFYIALRIAYIRSTLAVLARLGSTVPIFVHPGWEQWERGVLLPYLTYIETRNNKRYTVVDNTPTHNSKPVLSYYSQQLIRT